MSVRVSSRFMNWFGRVKRISDKRMTRKVCESNVEGRRAEGQKGCTKLRHRVKKAYSARLLGLRDTTVKCMDKE